MILVINELLKYVSYDGHIDRILWIDEGNIIAFLIDINSKEALPKLRKIKDILDDLRNERIVKVTEDPFSKYVDESTLELKNRSIRDRAWEIVRKIAIEENEPNIYYWGHRGKLISQVMEEFNVSKNMVYKYLRRYWQRGKVRNALLPDYEYSGGRGKEKTVGSAKRGRPRKHKELIGDGINVDEDTKKIFRVAIRNYYNTSLENPLKVAHDFMVKDFYTEDYRFENGIRKAIIIDPYQIPTMMQFKYWYEKENDIKKKITKRKGVKKYQLMSRAITGKSDADTIGPGSRYQIDATVADIYLVSRYNRDWIIGRPVIYLVVDVFSRVVTGLYVGLEGPSWIGAMMALANAASDKVQFCKEYGKNIEAAEWACNHIPEAILGDRGEMESKQVDTLINSLHVRIENTPPYRADLKGIVEQYFKILDSKVKPLVPGHINIDFRERGGKDYRLDAKLDLYQFTRIIINCVLAHNNSHWMENYTRDEDMITDDVEPIPMELWKWGITHRSGILRTFPEDIVKLNLMPADTALVTAKGIKFKKMYYSCNKAIEESWFEIARNEESFTKDISYDPRNMNFIYIRENKGRGYEKCYLLDDRKYFNKTLEEILYLDEYEDLEKALNYGGQLQSRVDLISEIEDTVNEAEMMSSLKSGDLSDSQKVKGIRENRKNEKKKNRETEAFELEGKTDCSGDGVINIRLEDENNEEELKGIEYLKRKQRERLNG